jgi:hypothetical protein
MKNFGLTALFAGLATALIQAGVVLTYGWPAIPWPVEVLNHPRVSFAEEARRAIFFSSSLAKSRQPMIVIAGASAAQEGYPPEIARTVAPNFLVHNFSMGGANISEVDQIIDHALKAAPPSDIIGRSLLVLAVSYPMFVPNQKRWRDPIFVPPDALKLSEVLTDIEREALRCPGACNPGSPFFKIAPGWIVALAKERYTLLLPIVRHLPVHLGDPLLRKKIWRQNPRKLLEPRSSQKSASETPQTPPEPYLVMAHRQMDFLTQYMGQPQGVLHNEQFERLKTLITKVRSYGFRVVVVDMPLPSWHREKSPFFAPYQTKLRDALASHLDSSTVEFVSLADAIPDDEFRDSVHPKEEAATHWASVLMEHLRALPSPRTN